MPTPEELVRGLLYDFFGDIQRSLAYAEEMACRQADWSACYGRAAEILKRKLEERKAS
jgi:hypothetical protein